MYYHNPYFEYRMQPRPPRPPVHGYISAPSIQPQVIAPQIGPGSIQPQPVYPPVYPPVYLPPTPPSTVGGCTQKWATMRLKDGRTLNVFVTSIAQKSLGGFLSTGQQIALDLDEILEMTC